MVDRIDRLAWGISSLAHAGLVAVALLPFSSEPATMPEPVPKPPPVDAIAAPQLRPVLERQADGAATSTAPLPELPPLQERPRPELDLASIPEPRFYHSLAERSQRAESGSGDDRLRQIAAEHLQLLPAPTLARPSDSGDRLTDAIVDRHTQEWQMASAYFTWLNGLQRSWRERWRDQYGHRIRSTRIVILVEIDAARDIRVLEISRGTGLPELDELILQTLRLRPPTRVPPTETLQGRLPIIVDLAAPPAPAGERR